MIDIGNTNSFAHKLARPSQPILMGETLFNGMLQVREQLTKTKKITRPVPQRRIKILMKDFPSYIPQSD